MTPEELIAKIRAIVAPVSFNAHKKETRSYTNKTCQRVFELIEQYEIDKQIEEIPW